jgi:glycosyltransferase involved in cell wall biosynthesis
VPVYNHGSTLAALAEALPDMPVFMVDDGSDAACKAALKAVKAEKPGVTIIERPRNGGKGAAMKDGFRAARDAGFTHALQIDADGQHDASRVPFFLETARAHPDACICGSPVYGEEAPASRTQGRKFANGWARLVTLSDSLEDVLCGFRVYPLAPVMDVYKKHHIDSRMAFDPDLLIRLYWAGTPVIFEPVRVSYPADGISHFHLFRDNVHISLMFSHFFFGMFFRVPSLLALREKK